MSVHHKHSNHIIHKLKDKHHHRNLKKNLKSVRHRRSKQSTGDKESKSSSDTSTQIHGQHSHHDSSFTMFHDSIDVYQHDFHNFHIPSKSNDGYSAPNEQEDDTYFSNYYENVVELLNNASADLLLKVIFIGIIITTILVRSNLAINTYYSVIFAVCVSYFLLKRGRMEQIGTEIVDNENLDKLSDKMNKKFNLVFSKTYDSVLYMNPALVKVFVKMCPFARFDTKNFKEALISANQLVRVYESAKLGQEIPNQTIDIAEALQRSVLNHMQSIIHSFPSTVIADYRFQVNLDILQKILQKIINDIKLIYDSEYKKNGPTIYNPPPSTRSGPWDNPLNSKEYNKYWNFYY